MLKPFRSNVHNVLE